MSLPAGNEPEMFTLLGKLNRAGLVGTQVAIAICACVAIYKKPIFAMSAFISYLVFVFYGEYYWPAPEYTPEFSGYAAKIIEEAKEKKSDISLVVSTYPFWFNKVIYLTSAISLMFVLRSKQHVAL
ncbi:MAG: hypothetical protein KBT55_08090 [Porticoccus sp.]|nr:hypothetical protein [Porticoccus sp.]